MDTQTQEVKIAVIDLDKIPEEMEHMEISAYSIPPEALTLAKKLGSIYSLSIFLRKLNLDEINISDCIVFAFTETTTVSDFIY